MFGACAVYAPAEDLQHAATHAMLTDGVAAPILQTWNSLHVDDAGNAESAALGGFSLSMFEYCEHESMILCVGICGDTCGAAEQSCAAGFAPNVFHSASLERAGGCAQDEYLLRGAVFVAGLLVPLSA